jgi:hypothetical protein
MSLQAQLASSPVERRVKNNDAGCGYQSFDFGKG